MNDTLDEFSSAALGHLRELVRVATRLTGDQSVAEDLVQETYLRAWRGFDRFERGTNCRAWLYKILMFVLSEHWRRHRREPRRVDFADLPEEALGTEPPVPDVLTQDRVAAAFEALPDAYRTVVLLADVEGLTYREIAEALTVPMGTVMSRLNRARHQLRAHLADRGGIIRFPAERRAR